MPLLTLSVVSLIGTLAVAASGDAFAATATAAGYGPPVTAVTPPGGFTAVITTVSIGPRGGTIGPVQVDGVTVTVTIPPGAFPLVVEITITSPDLTTITGPPGYAVVAGAGIQVTVNGAPYPGTFLKPVTATLRSPRITAASDVAVWNGTSFVIDQDSTAGPGAATVSFDTATDADFFVASPVSAPVTPVPGATTPVTGKPLLGEGILGGALVLAGAGGLAASRRRGRA